MNLALDLAQTAAKGGIRATYTTPLGPSPEDSCHETANMLDDFIG
jgi:hypothetical protein